MYTFATLKKTFVNKYLLCMQLPSRLVGTLKRWPDELSPKVKPTSETVASLKDGLRYLLHATKHNPLLYTLLNKMGKGEGYYAVRNGRGGPHIYRSWAECEANVKGFSNAQYKKFGSASEAQSFINTPSLSGALPTCSTVNTPYVAPYTAVPNHYTAVPHVAKQPYTKSDLKRFPVVNAARYDDTHMLSIHDKIVAYADGSAIDNGRRNAKAGAGVYFGPSDARNVSEKVAVADSQTNQRAELTV